MPQMEKHAPPNIEKNLTSSTWHHQRRAITTSLPLNLVIVDDATYLLWSFACYSVAHVSPIAP
jgi:hypothetical protein